MIKYFLAMMFAASLCTGCVTAMDGIAKNGSIAGYVDADYDIYVSRSPDPKGINLATTFVVKRDKASGKSDMIYANTAAQQGTLKTLGEQVLPAGSNVAAFSLTGVAAAPLLPKWSGGGGGGTTITTEVHQGGQFQGQLQGQGQGQTFLQGIPALPIP